MQAVLFDMDGVLVVSNPSHLKAWQEYGPRVGLVVTEEMFYREFSGRKNDEALEALFPGRFTAEEKTRMSCEKEALFRERFVPRLPAVPGVQELVRDLRRAGVKLALATSGPPENAAAILRHLGIEGAFDAVVTGQDVREAKPNPAIFVKAAERLGARAPESVVVEDSIAGVQAAVAAGAVCLGVATTEPPERLVEIGAARTVRDFRSLCARDLRALYAAARRSPDRRP